jgi:pyruvate ferredoxin oxidoreductase gamma subunit
MIALRAAALAREVLGRPVPNTALISAFLALTNILKIDSLGKAVASQFKGKTTVIEKNLQLLQRAAEQVPAGLWKEISRVKAA